ncbi:MAG: hypothetical protein AEth_01344 [Candidatus Argoarchaeum ethanivorans]|uniref:Type II toxin-antitoxin system HicA family toxin n=1 Tax=Candidatus Argoarchaeum ethanivorans TaxID=2608793 RepID=A0A8B3S2H9_9EURY|nr:MAG: hypothetical protein AEth_01344 [Candidatus Argoarchaeum ethanivorans]
MAKLPGMYGIEAVKAFNNAGWFVARQTGHTIMIKPGSIVTFSVPRHKELDRGTIRKLIKLAGLTVDDYA